MDRGGGRLAFAGAHNRLARAAQEALQALHEEMDDSPLFQTVELLGEAKMMQVGW